MFHKPNWTIKTEFFQKILGIENSSKKKDFQVGDYVLVGGTKMGCIKYIGTTKFSSGLFVATFL